MCVYEAFEYHQGFQPSNILGEDTVSKIASETKGRCPLRSETVKGERRPKIVPD